MDEVRQIAHRHPFKPFRVTLLDGEQIEIKRSLRTTVWPDRVIFGVDEDPETGVARRMRMIALCGVANVEDLAVAQPKP